MAFFKENQAFVMIGLYVFGILMGILSGLLFKKTLFRGEPVPFVMELPAYRLPSAKNVTLHMWEKAKDFIKKAFTIIFIATLVIWFLQSFDFRFNLVSDSSASMLAAIGRFLSPIFAPLGFADWRASTALITGLTAKEAVVSTFGVLFGVTQAELPAALGQIFTPLAALSFLAFTLLYTPCVAAINAARQELGSWKATAGLIVYQLVIAWIAAFAVYHIGLLFV